ncbi:MAG: hypothetical protein ABGW69_03425 [Nanoarchaeota archaeon]
MDIISILLIVLFGVIIGFSSYIIGFKQGVNKEKGVDISNSALYAYAKEIGNNPFIMYIHKSGTVKFIPIKEEDLQKGFVRIENNLHKLLNEKAMKLIYYDPEKKQYLTQDFLTYLNINVHPLDVETMFQHFLVSYLSDVVPLIDRVKIARNHLVEKLEHAKDPSDIEQLKREIDLMDKYIEELASKTKEKIKALTNDNLKVASQVMTPYQAKYLGSESKELTSEEIHDILKHIDGINKDL